MLHRVPRQRAIVERIVDRFVDLPRLLQASADDLEKVDGVGAGRAARGLRAGLSRLVESSVLERLSSGARTGGP